MSGAPTAASRSGAALPPGIGGEIPVLSETAFFTRNTSATAAGDLAPPVGVHGCKPTPGRFASDFLRFFHERHSLAIFCPTSNL
jgi:hypothetical protein